MLRTTTYIGFALAMALTGSAYGVLLTTTVPGTWNPWLSGEPNGTTSGSYGGFVYDTAPGDSDNETDIPVIVSPTGILLSSIGVTPGEYICFSATGEVTHGSELALAPLTGPNGATGPDPSGNYFVTRNSPNNNGSENGIADVDAPIDSLLGLFTDGGVPSTEGTVPEPLDFSPPNSQYSINGGALPADVIGTLNFTDLSPEMRQPFFIGDGYADNAGSGDTGQQHMYLVPAGATTLYFGTMDVYNWSDNIIPNDTSVPSFTVETALCGDMPEPGSLGLLTLSAVGLLFRRRRA